MLIVWLACVAVLAAVAALTYFVQQKTQARNSGRRQAPFAGTPVAVAEEAEIRVSRKLPQI